jgi:hypothetical protein
MKCVKREEGITSGLIDIKKRRVIMLLQVAGRSIKEIR